MCKYLTVSQELKHLTKEEYEIFLELSHIAKNLKNQAIYNARQYYFAENKYLKYEENYTMLKGTENYKILNSNISEQILKQVDADFKSYRKLIEKAKKGEYDFKKCRLPGYLPKDGFAELIVGFVRLNDDVFILPYSRDYKKSHPLIKVKMPPILLDKKIKRIKIVPVANARFFVMKYTYEVEETIQRDLNKNNTLALDLGVNNLVTAVTNEGKSFIIDGKKIKSINQWYNKENARLQRIKDKQDFGPQTTKRQKNITHNRNNKINDYMSKAARAVIDYCIANDIGTLVVGYNETFQQDVNLGNVNNQNFTYIPFGRLRKKLKYLCELNNITFVEQEESYTSLASFWDKDTIPIYDVTNQRFVAGKGSSPFTFDESNPQTYTFSGKRIHRGLYQLADGTTINADINGALNILRKSSVVGLEPLYSRGAVDTPIRIRVA